MINLYYVKGINRFDTPYFANEQAQANYFNSSNIKKSSVDTWYPPHYDNTIRLTSDDLNFNSQINYVGLEFNGKEYFYFIDDIRYIDEDTIEIDITMDVIQTYMFNIEWINSVVSKRLIDRWNGNAINRSYLRDNIGSGLYSVITYYEVPYKYPHIVIQSAESLSDASYAPSTFVYDGQAINDSTYSYFVIDTFKPTGEYAMFYDKNTPKQVGSKYTTASVMKWNDLAKIEKAYMFMYYQLGTVSEQGTDYTEFHISNSFNSGNNNFAPVLNNGVPRENFVQIRDVTITPDTYTISLPFTKNTSATASFDKKYIPQLIDENFIRVNFGERLGYTTYPVSLMTSLSLRGTAINDYKTGNRIFRLEETTSEKDKYMTTTINTTQENITLINDAYKNYLANHQGQLVMGMAKASVGAFIGVNSIKVPTPTYTPIRHKLSKKYLRKLERTEDKMKSRVVGLGSDLLNESVGLANAAFTPDTTKQGNSVTSDLYANSLKRFYSIEMCTDIDDVAKLLEGYGYKVHESYGNVNLFNTLNTRTYFNVIQCDEIEIGLTNVLTDDTTISEIIDRFNNGIRLWNVEIGKNLYVYDNVEKSYTSN